VTDLDLVPADALGFLTFRVADIAGTPFVKQTLEQLPPEIVRNSQSEMEKETGLTPADFERATAVVGEALPDHFWFLFFARKPYNRNKILAQHPGAEQVRHGDKSYHVFEKEGRTIALHFATDRLIVLGPEAGVKQCLTRAGKRGKGALDEALRLAAGKNHLFVGLNPQFDDLQQLQDNLPAGLEGLLPLFEARASTLTANLSDGLQLELTLYFADGAKAEKGKAAAADSVSLARGSVGLGRIALGNGHEAQEVLKQIETALKSIQVSRKGLAVIMQGRIAVDAGAVAGAIREGAQRAPVLEQSNNLKQLALAMHNYADAHNGQMPPAVIYDPAGQPLYSWRVELLPYLEEGELYREFHKDEAWDSPHNRRLLRRMPKVFALPDAVGPQQTTYYQVFTGPETPFAGKLGPRMPATFADGTSNTILIAEAASPVEWTRPADIAFQKRRPVRPLLGHHFDNATMVAMADGSVVVLPRTVSEASLHAAVTPAGADVLGPDWPGRK
jgi:hypothetical protein